ncbi:hypothetical protein DSL72_001802 [Monilinia vaccinii-corymbosi]|uniref:Uncharacterized protein n=1 Tax=Monilinia vaccinii-corymbosi TaxID=61207 RepID=A0A8A3PAV3_9HELO|nr:hypothetical protein DSL72_001802 [Monilinia vaccinii-corymbosi]
MRASSNGYFGEFHPSIDNDMIAASPHNDSYNGWLLSSSSSTMIVSKSDIRKPRETSSAMLNDWSTLYEDSWQETKCQFPGKNWQRFCIVETDPDMMEDLFESCDSEFSDDDPSSNYSSSTSSYPPEKEEEVWNRYFHAGSEYIPPPPPPTHRVYSLFPTTTPHASPEYNKHPTHKSWAGQPWPERLDSHPNRFNGRARAQTTPSQPNTPSNLISCTGINHPVSGSYIPANYRHTHPALPLCNSSTPLVLKSEFETDSDDEDDKSPSKMAKAIEEMFERFRSNGGASTKNGGEEKTKRSSGFRRSASEACEAVKGIFSKRSHGPSERRF